MTAANKTVLVTGASRGIGKALVDEALSGFSISPPAT